MVTKEVLNTSEVHPIHETLSVNVSSGNSFDLFHFCRSVLYSSKSDYVELMIEAA